MDIQLYNITIYNNKKIHSSALGTEMDSLLFYIYSFKLYLYKSNVLSFKSQKHKKHQQIYAHNISTIYQKNTE